jgi:glutathione peroxidase
MSFHDLTANTLDGKSKSLSEYKGKVVLVVNVASECGFTPQYAGLEKLYEAYKAKGLVVAGFPSNEFGKQEPGTSEQIAEFCSTKFGVQFPMFEKLETKGAGQSPVYKFLTASHDAPKWNFHKYLVGKNGEVKQAFTSNVAPESKELHEAIEAALAE